MSNKIKRGPTYNWVGIGEKYRYRRIDYYFSNVKYTKFELQVLKRPWLFGLLGKKRWVEDSYFSGVPRAAFGRLKKYMSSR